MTKFTTFIFGLFFVLASMSVAQAHPNDGIEGLVIGGVGGAVIGHVITGTPEGAIIGSFVGGTIGMLSDLDNRHNHVIYMKERPRHYYPYRPGYYERERWSHRGDRHYYNRRGHEPRWDNHRDRGHRW